MKKVKSLILLLFAIFACVHAHAQEGRIEAGIRFRKSQSVIDESFANNAEQLKQIVSLLDSLGNDPAIIIRSVEFCGAVSPEGPTYINRYERIMRQSSGSYSFDAFLEYDRKNL